MATTHPTRRDERDPGPALLVASATAVGALSTLTVLLGLAVMWWH